MKDDSKERFEAPGGTQPGGMPLIMRINSFSFPDSRSGVAPRAQPE
jgi:hypothetical protein